MTPLEQHLAKLVTMPPAQLRSLWRDTYRSAAPDIGRSFAIDPHDTQAVAGSGFGLFLLKELWFSNYAKSDLRYTCGAH